MNLENRFFVGSNDQENKIKTIIKKISHMKDPREIDQELEQIRVVQSQISFDYGKRYGYSNATSYYIPFD